MPQPVTLQTATFEEVWWDEKGKDKKSTPDGHQPKKVEVQFNPQTLKLNFSNQKAGGDQPKGSSTQFVGRGVTKLSLELWFDFALAEIKAGTSSGKKDVRSLTQEIAYFMVTQKVTVKGKETAAPPGLRFQWGSFTFEGVMDSMDETLDFFSQDGLPLRASVAVSISKQEIQYDATKAAASQKVQPAGLKSYTPVKAGKPFQQVAAEAGTADWQSLALANGIENPRLLAAGALVNLSADVSVGAGAQLGVSAGASIQLGVAGGAQVGAGAGVGGQAGVSVSGGSALGFVGSAQASAAGSLGFQGSASVSAGGSFGTGT